MPFFKTTNNIIKDQGEYFDNNWMDSEKIVLPPKTEWSYDREMTIEDVDLWEVIHEGDFGIYASYSPYAEFFMIFPFYWMKDKGFNIETFYGKNAASLVQKRAKEMDIDLMSTEVWLDSDQYEKYMKSKTSY